MVFKLDTIFHPHFIIFVDDKSFIHYAFFQSDDDQKVLFDLPSFKSFQEQLKASGPETPPKNELLTLVGASYEIFTPGP